MVKVAVDILNQSTPPTAKATAETACRQQGALTCRFSAGCVTPLRTYEMVSDDEV